MSLTYGPLIRTRFGYVAHRIPLVLAEAQMASRCYRDVARERAYGLFALTYHAAATVLTKVGEVDLAWIASDRGLAAAQQSNDPVVLGSLLRSVTHSLLSTGRYAEAVNFTDTAAGLLQPEMRHPHRSMVAVYGTLFLAGSMAAARANDRAKTREYLDEAGTAALRQGQDGNDMWTAFGPTYVDIHKVSTAMELGDIQVALGLGPRVDTRGLPIERRVRHALEVSRAYTTSNRRDEAVETLLDAEALAPEQVHYHYLSRHLVQSWIRSCKTKPPHRLIELAQRLHVA